MGLGGRKVKQRIGNDPRNLSWADDAARFGSNYLAKLGWDSSKGLGAEGEGRTSALKVAQKLDMLGIGAAHQKDPNGIAWKQNKDFEALLMRLNAANGQEEAEVKTNVSGFSRAVESNMEATTSAVASLSVVEVQEDVNGKGGVKKKKSKKDKKDKKSKTGKRKRSDDEDEEKEELSTKKVKTASSAEPSSSSTPVPSTGAEAPRKPYIPRHRAHRARAIEAKNIAAKSSTHISEILGIAPERSFLSSIAAAPTPDQGKLTVINHENEPPLEKLTTSTKSVADYFKEKMAAKANGGNTPCIAEPSGSSTPMNSQDEEDRPRGGLGMGFARVNWESSQQQVRAEIADGQSLRVGLSKFSELMSATFLTGTMSVDSPFALAADTPEIEEKSGDDEKKKRRERKRLKKEAKAKRKAEKQAKATVVESENDTKTKVEKGQEMQG